jgi:hypothetical protein
LNKDNKANRDGDDDESGKDGGTDGGGKNDNNDEEEKNDESDKENEANGNGGDGCGDGDNGGNDKHDEKLAKEGEYKKKPRPSVNNLVEPEKNSNLARVYKTASQRFSGYDTSKTKENQTKKRKRKTVQYNKSDVFANCVKTYQKTLNCQILEQKSFLMMG